MAIKYLEEYRDPELSGKIIENLRRLSKRNIRLMEVCGTHTVSIFRSGIRSILPETVSLLSGPGCPVCVTAQKEIDSFIEIAGIDNVIIATFGDLMRVPGTRSSLQKERADGRDIRVVYSAFDALNIAEKNPDKRVVFLGVGFETTAPTIAASMTIAKEKRLENYLVYSAHKIVPPAFEALMANRNMRVDGFILPGHVSVIIGADAYRAFFEKYGIPCVIAGFEPMDILQAIYTLTAQIEDNNPGLVNGYQRAVTDKGNEKAQKILMDVFEPADALWRGLGIIKGSGLKMREEFADLDAEKQFDIDIPDPEEPEGCACGEILTGVKIPPECSLYKKICTPMDPVGPCMVSSEGTCAAYYRYDKGCHI